MDFLTRLRLSAGLFRPGINRWAPCIGAVAKTLHVRRKRDSDKLPGK